MMKDYYDKSMRALQLAGMSDRTQECYTRSVRMLVDFYGKTPDQIMEPDLENYFLHRKNSDNWSAATMRICYSGIKFFFINVLKRDWHILSLVHANREKNLPTVLSVDEVRNILKTVNTPQNKTYLTTVYSCGLRLHEALFLQVGDIDGKRMQIHVHQGFNVNCRSVTGSHQSIRYLAPYVFKVAITDRRIIAVENDAVSFRYKKSGSRLNAPSTL